MIECNVLTALNEGYDVILEGILTVKSYGEILDRIFEQHPHENYIFYFDISFEETLKRHNTRESKNLFGEKDMREWYPAAHKSNHKYEHIIPERFSRKQTIEYIKKASGI